MKVYISGACKNGKSYVAQRLARSLPGPHYYLATMIPHDGEDEDRIARHRMNRDGWGFQTIERGVDIEECLKEIDPSSTLLVDSVTALLANEMFREDGTISTEAIDKVTSGLLMLMDHVQNIVFVSDYIYSDALPFTRLTEIYRLGLSQVDMAIAKRCDQIFEVIAGRPLIHKKGDVPPISGNGMHLITGGIHQGKSAYAQRCFALKTDDICRLRDNSIYIDFSKPIIEGLEQFALSCIYRNIDPVDHLIARRYAWRDSIMIAANITDGFPPDCVVERLWRESMGRMLNYLAHEASSITRMFLGVPQRLK